MGVDLTAKEFADKQILVRTAKRGAFTLADFVLGWRFKVTGANKDDSVIQYVVEEQRAFTKGGEVKDQFVSKRYVEGFELKDGKSVAIDVHSGLLAIAGAYTKVTKDFTLVAHVGQYKDGMKLLNVPAGSKYRKFADGAMAGNIVPNMAIKKLEISIHFELYADGTYYLSIPALKITEGKQQK